MLLLWYFVSSNFVAADFSLTLSKF